MLIQIARRLCETIRSAVPSLLTVLLCSCSRGNTCVGDVSEVTVHIWSGHVVPSWSENVIISASTVRLTRTGEAGSEVNAGTWEFAANSQDVARLFEQLKAVNWASIKEVPPDGPSVDGGGSTSYEIKCERETGRTLWFREGWTYAGGEAVTEPIEAFIASLTLPAEAVRFSVPAGSD